MTLAERYRGLLLGAALGEDALPTDSLRRLAEWPRGKTFLRRLADRLARVRSSDRAERPEPSCWPAVPLRNAFFLVTVLLHGFRRLLPPY